MGRLGRDAGRAAGGLDAAAGAGLAGGMPRPDPTAPALVPAGGGGGA